MPIIAEYRNLLNKFRRIKARMLSKKLKKYFTNNREYLANKGRRLLQTLHKFNGFLARTFRWADLPSRL